MVDSRPSMARTHDLEPEEEAFGMHAPNRQISFSSQFLFGEKCRQASSPKKPQTVYVVSSVQRVSPSMHSCWQEGLSSATHSPFFAFLVRVAVREFGPVEAAVVVE